MSVWAQESHPSDKKLQPDEQRPVFHSHDNSRKGRKGGKREGKTDGKGATLGSQHFNLLQQETPPPKKKPSLFQNGFLDDFNTLK